MVGAGAVTSPVFRPAAVMAWSSALPGTLLLAEADERPAKFSTEPSTKPPVTPAEAIPRPPGLDTRPLSYPAKGGDAADPNGLLGTGQNVR